MLPVCCRLSNTVNAADANTANAQHHVDPPSSPSAVEPESTAMSLSLGAEEPKTALQADGAESPSSPAEDGPAASSLQTKPAEDQQSSSPKGTVAPACRACLAPSVLLSND